MLILCGAHRFIFVFRIITIALTAIIVIFPNLTAYLETIELITKAA